MGTRLRLTRLCGLGLAVVLAGCSPSAEPAARPSPPSPETPVASPAPPEPPGTFERRPHAVSDFTGGTRGWTFPTGALVGGGQGVVLPVGGDAEVAVGAHPESVGEDVPVMIEADLNLPKGPGTGAGVWCRADLRLRRGYAFVVGRDGGWGLFRYSDGVPHQIERGAIDPEDLAEGSVRLRLACGPTTEDGVSLAVAYDDKPFIVVADPEGGAAPAGRRVGVLVSRRAESPESVAATLLRVTLWLGRP